MLFELLQLVVPSMFDAFAVRGVDFTDRSVAKLQGCFAVLLYQPVLHVRNRRVGHEQRAADLEERRGNG